MVDWGSEYKPHTIAIPFKDGYQYLTLQDDGSYIDKDGTRYPVSVTDPGYCGVSPFETGSGDPWWPICKNHDAAFNLARAGYQDSTKDNLKTFSTFAQAIGVGMLTGAYQVLSGPIYLLLGGVYGFFREQSESK